MKGGGEILMLSWLLLLLWSPLGTFLITTAAAAAAAPEKKNAYWYPPTQEDSPPEDTDEEEVDISGRSGVTFNIIDKGEMTTTDNNENDNIAETAEITRDVTFNLIPGGPPESFEDSSESEDDEANNTPIPYNFGYVYFIGGDCDNPDEWYSRWVKAGIETIPNVTRTICSVGERFYEYTWQFHVDALKEIELEVGPDKLNETLVITVGYGLEQDWTPVAELMRKGMGFFHGGYTQEIVMINLTQFNLREDNIFYMYFSLDEEMSALEAGREVCRLRGSRSQLDIAKIYPDDRNDLNFRIDLAVQAFREACPGTTLELQWEMERDTSPNYNSYKTKLRFNNLPDVVFTSQDIVAAEILNVASAILEPDRATKIAATGWDYRPEIHDAYDQILTSVDQIVFHPHRGLWDKISTSLVIAQENGIRSTKALREELELTNQSYIQSETLLISNDQVGFLFNFVTSGYDPRVAPGTNVSVTTGLYDVSITAMKPFEGIFDTVIWLRWSWADSRLAWNAFRYNGTINIDAEEIWIPQLFLANQYFSEELHTSPATVTPRGIVTMSMSLQATFLCSTKQGIISHPFDNYDCHIELSAPAGITLNQQHGFEVIETDPYFVTNWATNEEVADADNDELEDDDYYNDYDADNYPYQNTAKTVFFLLHFERDPFTGWVRMIIPTILINVVGFMAFWIEEPSDALMLGITSLLCIITIRESVQLPDTASVTWSETFMIINICYQAAVMVILWLSYSNSSKKIAKGLNKAFRIFHPKVVANEVKVERQKISETVQERAPRFAESFKASMRSSAQSAAQPSSQSVRSSAQSAAQPSSQLESSLPAIGEDESISMGDLPPLQNQPTTSSSSSSVGTATTAPFGSTTSSQGSTLRQRKVSSSGTTPTPQHLTSNNNPNMNGSNSSSVVAVGDRRSSFVRISARTDSGESEEDIYAMLKLRNQQNLTWLGRWIIVPSYVVVMALLLSTDLGFHGNQTYLGKM